MFECIVLRKEASLKRLVYPSNYVTFLKRQNYGDSNRPVVARGWGAAGGEQSEDSRCLGWQKHATIVQGC